LSIDKLAERILTLVKSPLSTYQEYINQSQIKAINTAGMEDTAMVSVILDDSSAPIKIEREIMESTSLNNDDGTNDMINTFMHFKEKNTRMLRALCGKN
jgi:starvation-inducible DNA-binding protein